MQANKDVNKKYTLAKIKVVGVGGAGGNAITRMFGNLPRGIDFIAVNTDAQDLDYVQAKKKIQIGKNITRGLGAGMNPDLGRQAAEENQSELNDVLKGSDMVFITAGLGGGTGSGAAPVLAELAKEMGILTVVVVTKPFGFEGLKRSQIADEAISKLRDRADAMIVIPNDRIFSLITKETSLLKAFEAIDEVLKNAVQGITELIMTPGIVNVDFADVRAILQDSGSAIIGMGYGSGQERALTAAKMAISSPLLEDSISGAKGVLFSIASAYRDLKMNEVNEIAQLIAENVDAGAKIIFGTYHDRKLKKGQLKVTLIATSFHNTLNKAGLRLPNFLEKREDQNFLQKKNDDFWEEKRDVKLQDDDLMPGRELPLFDPDKNINKKGIDAASEVKKDIWEIPAFLRKKKRKE
jgi:cell division protein FtsZ